MSILKRIGDIEIELGQEQMSTWDWITVFMYFVIMVAFLYFHTEVAVWVWLFVSSREIMHRRTHNKSIGKPLSKRNG